MKELQGLGLKVDLLDNGTARDADRVIEKTTEEVERQRDDSVIYAQHLEEIVEEDEEDMQEIDIDDLGAEDADIEPEMRFNEGEEE